MSIGRGEVCSALIRWILALLLEEMEEVDENERIVQPYDRRSCVDVLLRAAKFIKANHKAAWEGVVAVSKGVIDEQ